MREYRPKTSTISKVNIPEIPYTTTSFSNHRSFRDSRLYVTAFRTTISIYSKYTLCKKAAFNGMGKHLQACESFHIGYCPANEEKWTKKSKRADLWEKAHECNARRVLNLIVELEGLWVKLGQYLSTRADVLPPAYTPSKAAAGLSSPTPFTRVGLENDYFSFSMIRSIVLKTLAVGPGLKWSMDGVCRTITRELGKSMDGLFLNFDNTPLATASIAQVHRATLGDGQDVVVKVQHEGIKEIILEDLKNAKSIVDWIAWAEPQYNFNPMIDEWCKEAPKELDFNHEAENTRKVSRNLGCKNNCEDNNINRVDVLIPEIIMSTEKVLILEYMDGVRLNDSESLQALGVDKQKLVEEITRALVHFFAVTLQDAPVSVFKTSFLLCPGSSIDFNVGNFLVSKAPPHRPILLDFGLTKGLSSSMKHALAKMFLASAEIPTFSSIPIVEDLALAFIMKDSRIHVVITWHFYLPSQKWDLSCLDIPEQVMEIANQNMKAFAEQRNKNLKVLQEKMKLNEKEVKRLIPRVINLLRGLSSTMDVRVVYLDIMRPFAESVLQWAAFNANWIHDTPVLSNVEDKLRKLLIELGNADKVLGIQVCAYKDGEVIIDTAAGVLGRYDPRPVQPDSLFPVFSVSKGITAGMVHWLVDKGKLKLEDRVASVWPEFGSNGKDQIKVHHVLNHTSGLHNALASLTRENPLLMTDWDQCLNCLTEMAPETEPGVSSCIITCLSAGYVVHASRKKFQEILEEALITPLNLDGELYIGIPPGMFSALCELAFCSLTFSTRVESRLATLTSDMDDIKKLSEISKRPDIPSSFQFQLQDISQMASTLPALFNTLHARRSIIPAANAHCSARALARYYAALVDRGTVPPPHSSSTQPQLGSHPHIPKFSSPKSTKKQKKSKNAARNTESLVDGKNYTRVPSEDNAVAKGGFGNGQSNAKLFTTVKFTMHSWELGNTRI
ncbi:hypothetical protein DH2020_029071 [Rehmannia glutinosa]|uniref:Uncharacterized protein n=1 Tax=Rehmannia glutinosa TaxID=99300 RepID=A0ABR0VQI8_REHGL